MVVRRRGFTLIELLVVIAIIAVLIAALARRPGGPRGGPADAVHQQPQAARPGRAQLREQPTAPCRRSRRWSSSGNDQPTSYTSWGVSARLAPYMELGPLYNAMNFSMKYSDAAEHDRQLPPDQVPALPERGRTRSRSRPRPSRSACRTTAGAWATGTSSAAAARPRTAAPSAST